MVDPQGVVSPKSRLSGPIEVLRNTGAGGYSIARFQWDGVPAVGIRWNGEEGAGDVGNPQSRGLPTWFILPGDVAGAVLHHVDANPPDSRGDPEPTDEFEARLEAVAERVLRRLLEEREQR